MKLPTYYTEIQPVATADYKVPKLENTNIQGVDDKTDADLHHEVEWLEKVGEVVDSCGTIDKSTNAFWGNFHSKELELADPLPGRVKNNSKYEPLWTLDAVASDACRELVKCRCKSKENIFYCNGRCSCRKIDEDCTDLCHCKGKCQWTMVERKKTVLESTEESDESKEDEGKGERDSEDEVERNDEMENEDDLLIDVLLEI